MKWVCEQRGCGEYAEDYFDAGADEHLCPVCGHPLIEHDGEVCQDAGDGEAPWTDYTVPELREYAESWELSENFDARTTKDGLIAILEAAEALEAD